MHLTVDSTIFASQPGDEWNRKFMKKRRIYLLKLLIVTLSLVACSDLDSVLRLEVTQDGIHRLSGQDLRSAGWKGIIHTGDLSLKYRGESVGIWVEDGGDGRLDLEDYLEFKGERLRGNGDRLFHRYSMINVYHLDRRGSGEFLNSANLAETGRSALRTFHLEENHLMVRLTSRDTKDEVEPDPWYWKKLTPLKEASVFSTDLNLEDLDPTSSHPMSLRVRYRGMSTVKKGRGLRGGSKATKDQSRADAHDRGLVEEVKDHMVELTLGDQVLQTLTWDGRNEATFDVSLEALKRIEPGIHQLTQRVVRRKDADKKLIIDVVMLDFVEVTYPSRPRVLDRMVALQPVAGPSGAIEVLGEPGTVLIAQTLESRSRVPVGPSGAVAVPWDEKGELWVAREQALLRPRITALKPPSLRTSERQADYLVITHPSLEKEIIPLVEAHTQRGLRVAVVSVENIYEEFNHGIVHPRAIRDFIAHAYHEWEAPRPRYVLLVGDASWDIYNDQADADLYADWTNRVRIRGADFGETGRPTYDSSDEGISRNLIPTGSFQSSQGHSASDNYFVTVEGDDYFPDLAIGRFPVVSPQEVGHIVQKTLMYLRSAPVGPWRRSILWITNEEKWAQRTSDSLAEEAEVFGYGANKVYPQPEESDNSLHQGTLQDAFNEGQLLVHFYGHGGRHIWRTGPPDLEKNHDLFTLDHVDGLEPNERLPLILSMTCYSAPFDHPTADSIGEKFLRVPNRGAVAVFAASWRNSPRPEIPRTIIREITQSRTSIGEAIRLAKQGLKNRNLIEQYNLLGDPALTLAVPDALNIELLSQTENYLEFSLGKNISGEIVVDFFDTEGAVFTGEKRSHAGDRVLTEVPEGLDSSRLEKVSVYFWNEAQGVDALGVYQVNEKAPS